MNNHTPYKILTYILLPIIGFLGLTLLIALLGALANPKMLLSVFLLGGVVVYYFTAFNFFNKGVLHAKPLKHSLKDWVRVNAFVSIALSALIIINSIGALMNPSTLKDAIHQFLSMQKANVAISEASMVKFLNGFIYGMIAVFVLLLVHVFLTFRLLKQYKHVFDKDNSSS
jgi:hypothetical protein